MYFRAIYNTGEASCNLTDPQTAREFCRVISNKVKYVVALLCIHPKTNEHEISVQVPGHGPAGVPADGSVSESDPQLTVCTPRRQPQYHPQGDKGHGAGEKGEGRGGGAGLADVHGFTNAY